MASGPLQLKRMNAVIVGDGAIGAALLDALLEHPGLERVAILRRGTASLAGDHRVTPLSFDAEDPDSVAAAADAANDVLGRVHLLINTVGMLHGSRQQPEKRVRDVRPEALLHSFAINAVLLPLLAQSFGSLLRHDEPAVLASLSARVGSIEDNGLGGWYSYRASKAAHNMLLRTLAREWRVSHRNATVVALHPGTVDSRLSRPFLSSGYRNKVLTPGECADSLLGVIDSLGPEQSGSFYDWQGKPVPW
jgi:NAD(P)-dependent dehydrogenase (short-subunit alcohol dehydrogenase family)